MPTPNLVVPPCATPSALDALLRSVGRGQARNESVASTLAPAMHPDDVLAQVDDVMRRMPPEEVPDPEAFRCALNTLLREGEGALRRYASAPGADRSPNDRAALEAIIRVDGTRPSLLLRDGRANPDHPLAKDWADTLRTCGDLVCERAMSVGLVGATDPAKQRDYYGTAWMAEAGRGLALTNLHVLLELRAELPHLFKAGDTQDRFRVRPGVTVDFSRESNRLNRPPFRVVEAEASGIEGLGFGRLDLATLRLEPTEAGQAIPAAIPLVADLDVANGARDMCVIGYPGPPDDFTTADGRVDWGWVVRTLFGSTFGVKRLAPGRSFRNPGKLPGDARAWVFGHDATTLGGSSGSLVMDWQTTGAAVGIHFAGSTLDTNVAHALSRCRERIEALGVPVRDA